MTYKLTDKWIEACAECPADEYDEYDEYQQGVQAMARELLALRQSNPSGVALAMMAAEHSKTRRELLELQERLAAAERVVEACRYWYDEVPHGIHDYLDAYDKVVNTTVCKSVPNA